jgi:hypothetical protein
MAETSGRLAAVSQQQPEQYLLRRGFHRGRILGRQSSGPIIMVRKRRVLFTTFMLLAPGLGLGAQDRAASSPSDSSRSGRGQILGVVLDSLNGRYLSGAEVLVEGVDGMIETDSLGKFRIDHLTPGTYQVGVFHPLLDTLGIGLATRPFHVGPDSSSFVLLAIPSAATLIRRTCPGRSRADDASAVIGHVSDPETLQPVAHAEVSVAWTDYEVSKEEGVRRTSRLVRDSTDGTGSFKICGLPSPLDATIQARRGSAITAEIPISLGDRRNALFARVLLLSKADSGAKFGHATVSGQVVLEGSPINAGSRVELLGTDIVVITNDKGEFTMQNLPSGSKILLARHVGFRAETAPVDLSSLQQKRVTIKLSKFVAVMDPVLVTARRSAALDKLGFNQRKNSGFGYYLGPDRLQNMHPNYVTDILRQVPGLRVSHGRTGDVVSSSRGGEGGCVQYYVDDMPFREMDPGEINLFVSAGEVVAVEVYQGANTPARFVQGGFGSCTTIVLWTRFKTRD